MKKAYRIISMLAAFVIFIQTLPYTQQRSSAEISTQFSGYINIGGATISYDQSLLDNKNGTYTLEISLESFFQFDDRNTNTKVSKNGYFTARQSGEYLIELWGGDGAPGQDSSYSAGGSGGNGGHVYGTVYLKEGETIYYTLGGDGTATISEDEGGGVNGDGGNHGDTGSYTVGGGGGYSAVYKFAPGEFEAAYLDENGELISEDINESERTSKYILIAGGGGGGGAGNGFSLISPAVGTPDGGNGGAVGGTYGILSGDGYDVQGTFFSGEDGKSSGTSIAYVGHGGTNLPGSISDTLLTMFEGVEPNDWKGTHNKNKPGGYGGSGNLRGGGGGAGFCGGSGGVMTGLLTATNVGGGGGGSSFIADTVDYNLDESSKRYLKENNPSETGGSVCITYLGLSDVSFLNDLQFTGEASQYFRILQAETSSGTITVDELKRFTLKGASLLPDTDGNAGDPLIITVYFAPKIDFAGGNNVPLLENDKVICKTSDGQSREVLLGNNCRAVNVPLNFRAVARSYTTNTPGVQYPVSNFYNDQYKDIRDDLSKDWRYHFISEITPYQVAEESTGSILDVESTVAPLETTRYKVFFNVTPRTDSIAAVGEAVEKTTFSATAVYTVLNPSIGDLNGKKVSYQKSLSFDSANDYYILNLNVRSDSTGRLPAKPADQLYIHKYDNTQIDYTIEQDGYYLLQAWGGNGGSGIDYSGNEANKGGSGGYVSGYIHLTEGDKITVDAIGMHGQNGTNWTNVRGGGGEFTRILVTRTDGSSITALIAGGGGGGGGRNLVTQGSPGESVPDDAEIGYEPTGGDDDYNGESGSELIWGARGGAAGRNFKNSEMDQEDANHALTQESRDDINLSSRNDYDVNVSGATGGAARITCIQQDRDLSGTVDEQENDLIGYSLTTQLSQYFDIISVTGYNGNDSSELKMSANYNENGIIEITDINPEAVTDTVNNSDGTTTVISSVDFTIKFSIKPKEGFLGGNDVPLLDYNSIQAGDTGIKLSQPDKTDEVIAISRQNDTDFANVSISYHVKSGDLETYDKTYLLGDEGIPIEELYKWSNRPLIPDDWRSDFVKLIEPSSEVLTPNKTTAYEITVGISPKAEPQRATVIPAVQTETVTGQSTVFAETEIIYQLTNMETDDTPDESGRYIVPVGEKYTATLIPRTGYEIPNEIAVTINGEKITDYSFDRSTGTLIIPADNITGRVVITAAGKIQEYTLHYVYETSPSGKTLETTQVYRAGDSISPIDYEPETYPGYQFVWDWGDWPGDENDRKMPAQNWWVTGKYIPINYTVTINYYYIGTTNPVEGVQPVKDTLPYGAQYKYISPSVSGYIADSLVVSGTVTGDEEINVYYIPTQNQLNILYIQSDTGEIVNTYTEYLDTGAYYNIATPCLEGYTPDMQAVSGTMTDKGITVYVYYQPNVYTVEFDANGGNCSVKQKQVVYNNIYGYDGQEYSALPVPVRVGYIFDGWYIGDTLITEETTVTIAGNHKLTAKWKALNFSLTIQYIYEDGTPAAEAYSGMLAYNQPYEIISPQIPGYTADKLIVSGTVYAQNTNITVTYKANEYKLTIHYYSAVEGENSRPLADDYTDTVTYGEVYEVASPQIDGYIPSMTIVNGIMDDADCDITVWYYQESPVIAVTVEWGELIYDYTHGMWNPEKHEYEAIPIEPHTFGKNSVTVSNDMESNISVNAAFSYRPDDDCRQIGGYFTHGSREDEKIYTAEIMQGDSVTAYLWLEGTIPRNIMNTTIIGGTCTVTIRGGKK